MITITKEEIQSTGLEKTWQIEIEYWSGFWNPFNYRWIIAPWNIEIYLFGFKVTLFHFQKPS